MKPTNIDLSQFKKEVVLISIATSQQHLFHQIVNRASVNDLFGNADKGEMDHLCDIFAVRETQLSRPLFYKPN